MNRSNKTPSENTPVTDQEVEEALSHLVSTPGLLEAFEKASADADADWSTRIRNVLLTIAAKEMELMAHRLRNGPNFVRDEEVAVRFAEILWEDIEIPEIKLPEPESMGPNNDGDTTSDGPSG